jgi:hypothetical protein
MALNKPRNKAIFFNNFSFFRDISEGNKNLKIEFSTPSIYLLSFKFLTVIKILMFRIHSLYHSQHKRGLRLGRCLRPLFN